MKASGSVSHHGKVLSALVGLLLPLSAPALLCSCEKDEPPPPLPSAAPAPTPPAPEVLTITEEDAAVDAEEPKKTGKGGGSAGSLSACCAALEQNAANAPEPNASYMKSAALACRSAVAAGQTQGAALAAVRAALRTAGMPTACK